MRSTGAIDTPAGRRLGDHPCRQGEIDYAMAEDLTRLAASLPATGDVHLELDDLTSVDAAGARALVSWASDLAPTRRLVLHDPPPNLDRILAMATPRATGIDVVSTDPGAEVGA